MRLLTTTIGAYPKPDFVPIPDRCGAEAGPDTGTPTGGYPAAPARIGEAAEAPFARAARQVVEDQVAAHAV